jgi:hypothetical protein
MEESRRAYREGAALQQKIQNRLTEVERQTETARPVGVKQRPQSRVALNLLQTFRRPETTRQAFLASFVLNPPRALDPI